MVILIHTKIPIELFSKTGKIVETHSFILDMDNFSMKALAWKPGIV